MRDTPSRLRDAAERLLADRPAARISLRDITEAAGANVASVGYHFGSKDALLDEVMRGALTEVFEHRRARLAQLPDDADLADIVRAWVLPSFPTGEGGPREHDRRRHQVLQHVLAAPSPATTALLEEMAGPVQEHLLNRISHFIPEVSPAELRLRHAAVIAALGALNNGSFTAVLAGTDPAAIPEQLVTWIVGGLTAPPTTCDDFRTQA
ncbi:TetR/AcrR family transcriptional regulator [Paractinoplanes abujensis]|uniref:AcrR family transcriptional regulator n=1 Tax=Paractinoplanes abujensis TaxID=882441 RepID=A0A7W7CSA3_9ACTN|nr:TetR/AcrR family transcriptional regulator [Actinoplanes abujensis]MBB4693424.1 AcrR family transcriptional regulator [Actinoplanes abujensis]